VPASVLFQYLDNQVFVGRKSEPGENNNRNLPAFSPDQLCIPIDIDRRQPLDLQQGVLLPVIVRYIKTDTVYVIVKMGMVTKEETKK